MLTRTFTATAALALAGWLATTAHAQTPAAPTGPSFYKCKDAQGRTHFTDTGCGNMASTPLSATDNANLQDRKAQNDARVERDKRLADQLEAQRVGAENAAQAARAAQLSADRGVESRLAGERDARNAAATSVLSPSTCQGCRSLGF